MNYQNLELNHTPYIACLPGDGILASEADALDLVAICGEHLAPRLLLHEENLHPDFFDLKTGLAGAAMLKWSNYQVKVAMVLSPERATSGRFRRDGVGSQPRQPPVPRLHRSPIRCRVVGKRIIVGFRNPPIPTIRG